MAPPASRHHPGAPARPKPLLPHPTPNPPAPPPPPAPAPSRLPAALALIPAVYFIFVASEFAAMTALALALTEAGRPALQVGALASAMWAGILLASHRAHRPVARFGHAKVMVAATALATVALLSYGLHTRYPLWLAGAFALGVGGGLVWVAGESWLAEAAPADRRGFWVGLFETSVGLGLMAGPALVPLSRALGVPTLALAGFGMLLALAASARLLREPLPPAEAAAEPAPPAAGSVTSPPRTPALAGPLIAIAVVSGLMEAGVSALLPSVAMRSGFTLEGAAWLGTVIGAGSALLQPPAGWAADRIGVRRATLVAWSVVVAATLALLLASGDAATARPTLWAAGFALGGFGGAVYTLLIVELGHRLAGGALVRAIGVLVVGYSAGTAVGPSLGGAVFDAAGLGGLAALLLALGAAGLAITLKALHPAPAAPQASAGR